MKKQQRLDGGFRSPIEFVINTRAIMKRKGERKMIRVLSLDDLVRMTKEEFSVAWEEGTIHASVYESLGIEWEPVDENEEIVFAI